MIRRVNGVFGISTDGKALTLKTMIRKIVRNMQKDEPQTDFVDYTICLRDIFGYSSSLHTEKNKNYKSPYNKKLRNVSMLYVNYPESLQSGICAVIGNKTGNLLLEAIPTGMNENAAILKILEFLKKLQPENCAKSKKDEKLIKKNKRIEIIKEFENYSIIKTIFGGKGAGTEEMVEDYINL